MLSYLSLLVFFAADSLVLQCRCFLKLLVHVLDNW